MQPGETVTVKIGKIATIQAVVESESTCNGPKCKARIVWARTPSGAMMPLNPPVDGAGEVENHWGTCPDRQRFHRKRR